MATFKFMFLVNDGQVSRDKTVCSTRPGTMVHVIHVLFTFFTVFKNLKSSFSEDNMPFHALDVFNENVTKMV